MKSIPKVHIIGAGLSGLACAIYLTDSNYEIHLYDSASNAGGRCRSFHDDVLNCVIDNGNHLMLSGNKSVYDYLEKTGAKCELTGPDRAIFPFVDLQTGKKWTVDIDEGRWPWWLLSTKKRPPSMNAWDVLNILKLITAGKRSSLGDIFDTESQVFRQFWEPLAVGVLNTPAELGSAKLLASVFRETFGRGGTACKPRMVKTGLSETFVQPALNFLRQHNFTFRPHSRLRKISNDGVSVTDLHFVDTHLRVLEEDKVVLALPPYAVNTLIKGIKAPSQSYPIVNAHFIIDHDTNPIEESGLLGIVGGTAHWIFFKKNVLSATVSAADDLTHQQSDQIANMIWQDIRRAINGIQKETPELYRIVKERRATFAQTPDQLNFRAGTNCEFENMYLAGDWIDTGLPATIEGSIRSGILASQAIINNES